MKISVIVLIQIITIMSFKHLYFNNPYISWGRIILHHMCIDPACYATNPLDVHYVWMQSLSRNCVKYH